MDWIIIDDVSEHGISSGLVMMVQTSIRTILDQHLVIMPSELLSRVNQTITQPGNNSWGIIIMSMLLK